ncbi:MAG: extracellular solute-binding protein [Hyphomicrobiaceae bacterium]
MCRVAAFAIAAIAAFSAAQASANDVPRQHALSLVDPPRYANDFTHFSFVNPEAPKGGRVRQYALGTFDSLNPFSIRGNSAIGLTLTHDSLMFTTPDEVSVEYCLICEWVSHPPDFSSVTFKIRDEARFSDGTPITTADVIWSLEAIKKANPRFDAYYKNVVGAEETGPNEVTFRFDQANNRELPQIVGQLYVLSKAYWTGTTADGRQRDLGASLSEAPVSSGPYVVADFEFGRRIRYRRSDAYWARDLPVMRGLFNFDELVWDYFRDQTAAFEAFKAGDLDFWTVSSAKQWATEFNFAAANDGRVKRDAFPILSVAPMQAFVMNLRRPVFADRRVRQAFNLAFDFEWANRNLFYEQYERLASYFDNSELAARGLPEGRELELLNEVRDKVPAEVFTTPYANPVNITTRDTRDNLRTASELLKEAGWQVQSRVLTNAAGQKLQVEFLLVSPLFERIVLPYIRQLARLGIEATVRVVDSSQYQQRTDTFDFDIIVDSFPQSFSPGNEQRDFWGSAAADREGSRNTIGIKNPAVDALIDKVIFASSRAELVAATRALDRVLLWNHYVVPQWHSPTLRFAWWDRYEWPERLAKLNPSFLLTGWAREAKQ